MQQIISHPDLAFIGKCFLNDVDLSFRTSPSDPDKGAITKLVQLFTTYGKNGRFIYTAFDGDHFHFLRHMRIKVLEEGFLPANPESILGYKNIVTRYQSKYGVLLDDLAILKNCDELWIFTNEEPRLESLERLPEGVLVELAFFLKRQSNAQVKFVQLSELAKTPGIRPIEFKTTFDIVEKFLRKIKRQEVIEMANNNFKIDKELKNLVFFITDPLDHKYSEWLREGRSNSPDDIALIPGLTIKISDAMHGLESVGNIVLSWASMLYKLSTSKAFFLNSFEKRNPSIIAEAFKLYCIQLKGKRYLEEKRWLDYSIPKAVQKERWPITNFESEQIKDI